MNNARKVFPKFDEEWKHAPIQLEVCGTMQQWKEKGWTAEGFQLPEKLPAGKYSVEVAILDRAGKQPETRPCHHSS